MSRKKFTKAFQLNRSIDILFPLFSAEGEKLWVPDWDYENVMGTTELHEDYIFLTEMHDYASTKAIWLVKQYEPEAYHVQFYKVEPDDKVATITVQLREIGEEETEIEVSYEYVGLSDKGNAFVEGYAAEDYDHYINEWQQLLEQYFKSEG